MSNDNIRPVDHSCQSYRPGHQVHFIQSRNSWEAGQPELDVSIVVHGDGLIDLRGEQLILNMWNHDPARLRAEWESWGRAVWKPRFHVLGIPGFLGYAFSLATADNQSPCTWKSRRPAIQSGEV